MTVLPDFSLKCLQYFVQTSLSPPFSEGAPAHVSEWSEWKFVPLVKVLKGPTIAISPPHHCQYSTPQPNLYCYCHPSWLPSIGKHRLSGYLPHSVWLWRNILKARQSRLIFTLVREQDQLCSISGYVLTRLNHIDGRLIHRSKPVSYTHLTLPTKA